MSKQIENEKGFLVIEISKEEARKIGFGVPHLGCICMQCNNIIEDKMYYIAVLNDVMCKECYDEYMKSAHYYPEDYNIEKRRFDNVMNRLNNIK